MSTETTKPESKPGAALPGQTVVAKGKAAAVLGKPTPTFEAGSLLKDGRPESVKAAEAKLGIAKIANFISGGQKAQEAVNRAISPDPRPSAVPKTPGKPVVKPAAPAKPKSQANPVIKPAGKQLVKAAFSPKPGAAKLAPGKTPGKVGAPATKPTKPKAVTGKPVSAKPAKPTGIIAHKKPETQKPKPGDSPEVAALLKKRDAIRTKLGSADPAYQDLNGKIARLRNPEKYRAGVLKRRPKVNELVREKYHKDPKFRESVLEAAAKWRGEHKEEIAEYNAKRKTSPQYRGATTVRNYVTGGLKPIKSSTGPKRDKAKFLKMIGCTREEFQKHISAQFTKGMTFDSFRQNWTFEFIKKLADFDLSKDQQQTAAANYKNVRVVALE